MKTKRNKEFLSISAVAKMFSVHQQTIRLYEKQGLLTPVRSEGNTRQFSEKDIDRLEEIIYLTHELGINIAGVEMVLKLKNQVSKMQEEMNELFERAQKNLDEHAQQSKRTIEESAKRLVRIKNEPATPSASQPEQSTTSSSTPLSVQAIEPIVSTESAHISRDNTQNKNNSINWEVEYEE
jgi:MerR family transcriptional regulator/heat shock protein HspR